MNFLDISSSCNDAGLLTILGVVKNVMNLIQIIAPILLLVMTTVNFIQLIRDPDDKKKFKRLQNSAIATVVIFFIPVFINVLFGMLGNSTTFSSCWNNANIEPHSSTYMNPYDNQGRSSVITNPSDYEKGSSSGGGTTVNGNGSSHSSGKIDGSTSSNSSSASATTSSATGNRTGDGNSKASRTIFIGDSRTVQMYAYLNGTWQNVNYSSGGVHVVGNDVYVAEGAKGLDWMKSTGIPAAQQYFTSGSAIVILMGVNDLVNVNNYISYVNSNASSWKSHGSSLYFVSVNPCDKDYSSMNSKIASFNSQMKNGLASSVGWIDTYSYLLQNGYSTTDGLHYNKTTYEKIYNYIKSRV